MRQDIWMVGQMVGNDEWWNRLYWSQNTNENDQPCTSIKYPKHQAICFNHCLVSLYFLLRIWMKHSGSYCSRSWPLLFCNLLSTKFNLHSWLCTTNTLDSTTLVLAWELSSTWTLSLRESSNEFPVTTRHTELLEALHQSDWHSFSFVVVMINVWFLALESNFSTAVGFSLSSSASLEPMCTNISLTFLDRVATKAARAWNSLPFNLQFLHWHLQSPPYPPLPRIFGVLLLIVAILRHLLICWWETWVLRYTTAESKFPECLSQLAAINNLS